MSAGIGGGVSRDKGAGFTCGAATFKLPIGPVRAGETWWS